MSYKYTPQDVLGEIDEHVRCARGDLRDNVSTDENVDDHLKLIRKCTSAIRKMLTADKRAAKKKATHKRSRTIG